MAASPLSVDQFAAQIKAKYPQYQSVDNAELAQRIVAKYPQYKDRVSFAPPVQPNQPDDQTSFTDKILAGAGVLPNIIKQLGNTDQDLPLTSWNNATQQGYRNIARGAKQGILGFADLFKAPQDSTEKKVGSVSPVALPLYRMLHGAAQTGQQAAQVPQAVRDINQSPDPVGAYGQVAARTAGEGAGQAIDALAMDAAPKLPAAVDAVKNIVPSKLRAGKLFSTVMSNAGDVPVDMSVPGNSALRIQELADRGASMPMVVRKFLKRVTDPEMGPITYQEARDFQSNVSRLSADEQGRLTPAMRAEVAKFSASLKNAVGDAAESVGQGQNYRDAMSQYRKAAQLGDLVEGAKEIGKDQLVKGLGYGAGGVLGGYLLQSLLNRK